MKYTVIYTEAFMCGSHRNVLVQKVILTKDDNETIKDMLIREDLYYSAQYVYEGELNEIDFK